MSSIHYLRGISIAAIAAMAAATYDLTDGSGVARLKSMAVLICSLKVASRLTQKPSYLASYIIHQIAELEILHLSCLQ